MTKEERADYISDQCAFHNCEEKQRKIHYDQFVKNGWHPHPLSVFKKWWEPTGFAGNGASRGGHREAFRCWIKLETGERRWYGTKTEIAWNTEHWRQEFRDWVAGGMNEDHHNWNSTTALDDKMIEVLRQCRETLRKGTLLKGITKIFRTDYKPGQEPDSTHVASPS